MGVLKFFEGSGDLECVVITIRNAEGSLQKVVDGHSFSIGRAPDCIVSIPHAGVSRLHLLVTVKRGEVYIIDQDSSNGTFVNGTRLDAKKMTHIKPTDEIKIGLSDVTVQFQVLEKHFRTDYIAESLLPNHEKDHLQDLIKASHHKAQEVIGAAQSQADHIVNVATEKSRNLENQTLLKQEEIISAAQVEGQHVVAEAKRKAAQILLENEEKTKQSCQSIYDQAERIRQEAEAYFQNRVREAEARGTEIIEQHTKIGQDLVEDIKEKTSKKTENEIREKLAQVLQEIDERSQYLFGLRTEIEHFEKSRRNEIESELANLKKTLAEEFEKERQEKLVSLQSKVKDLEQEYQEKKMGLEKDYLSRVAELDRDFSEKKKNVETDLKENYEKLSSEIESKLRKETDDAASSLLKQKQLLDSELQSQRLQLAKVTSDLNAVTEEYTSIKSKFDGIKDLVQGLQKNESDLIASLNEKRDQVRKTEAEREAIKSEIDALQEKFITTKNTSESQIEEYQLRLNKLKQAFEAESEKLKKSSEQEIEQFQDQIKKAKEELEYQLKHEKAEIHQKTMDYMDSERAKMDEYRAQILREKKELDSTFDKTRKEFELKTKEVIELEKQKVEEAKQALMASLNRERQIIAEDITISIMKIKNHENLSATSVSDTVSRVLSSHVSSNSVSVNLTTNALNLSKLKAQYLGYGVATALGLVLAFSFFIQPQMNRHIAGTEEHAQAQVPVERPKYRPEKTLELKATYADAVIYTQGFSEIYLDEQLKEKWLKFITTYMYETWRVDETRAIEAMSMSRALVQQLQESAVNLDGEFYEKGIEKMREMEADSQKRMVELLGTQVKYEAYRRKEKEFFEPYIQNQ